VSTAVCRGVFTCGLRWLQLENGMLCVVPPLLMKRLKQHFVTLPCGVDVILGVNGYIWITGVSACVRSGVRVLYHAETVCVCVRVCVCVCNVQRRWRMRHRTL
jgi:exosome complex RNA-binding protein Rrp4